MKFFGGLISLAGVQALTTKVASAKPSGFAVVVDLNAYINYKDSKAIHNVVTAYITEGNLLTFATGEEQFSSMTKIKDNCDKNWIFTDFDKEFPVIYKQGETGAKLFEDAAVEWQAQHPGLEMVFVGEPESFKGCDTESMEKHFSTITTNY